MLTKGKKVETFSYLTPLNLTQLWAEVQDFQRDLCIRDFRQF